MTGVSKANWCLKPLIELERMAYVSSGIDRRFRSLGVEPMANRTRRFALLSGGNRTEVPNIAVHIRGMLRSTNKRTRIMQRTLLAAFIGLTLGTLAVAQTASAQSSDWRQAVGGLLTGNQDHDKTVQQAYERGYQRGRDDEARQSRAPRQPGYGNGGYNQDRGGYYNSR